MPQRRITTSWYVYNLSLRTGKSQLLIFGYGVKLLDWIRPANDELAVTYYDCWECEAATLFTTMHFSNGIGWRARWPNQSQATSNPQPGAVALLTDVGDPYDDNDVDQVFAVVGQPGGRFAVGSWFLARDTKTRKIEDDFERYSIDPKTGKERVEKLAGQAALDWERRICTQSNSDSAKHRSGFERLQKRNEDTAQEGLTGHLYWAPAAFKSTNPSGSAISTRLPSRSRWRM